MTNLDDFKPADWAVLGTSGLVFIISLLGLLYASPYWRQKWKSSTSLTTLWFSRTILTLALAALAASQISRLYSLLWNPNSTISSDDVTQWTSTSQGYMCRIYLTATLGVFAPLSAWLALFILDSGRSHRHRRPTVAASPAPAPAHEEGRTGVEAYRTTNYDRSYTTSLRSFRSMQNKTSKKSILLLNFRIVSLALLCTLPILLLQTAVAWISIWVKWDNQDFEEQPRSVLGFFLATFWYGNGPHECGDVATATDNNNNNNNTQECIACVFPAAAAVLHLLWTLAFIISLWNVSHRLSESAINLKIKRRLRVFVVVYTLIAALGCASLGASIAWSPFTWVNQGLWLGYFASVVAISLLLIMELVVLPVKAAHAAANAMAHEEEDLNGFYWRPPPPLPNGATATAGSIDGADARADITTTTRTTTTRVPNDPSKPIALWPLAAGAAVGAAAGGLTGGGDSKLLVPPLPPRQHLNSNEITVDDDTEGEYYVQPSAPPEEYTTNTTIDSTSSTTTGTGTTTGAFFRPMEISHSHHQQQQFQQQQQQGRISALHRTGSAASLGTPRSMTGSALSGYTGNYYYPSSSTAYLGGGSGGGGGGGGGQGSGGDFYLQVGAGGGGGGRLTPTTTTTTRGPTPRGSPSAASVGGALGAFYPQQQQQQQQQQAASYSQQQYSPWYGIMSAVSGAGGAAGGGGDSASGGVSHVRQDSRASSWGRSWGFEQPP